MPAAAACCSPSLTMCRARAIAQRLPRRARVHRQHDGNVSAGARFAGVDRKHWRELLKKHGLHDGE